MRAEPARARAAAATTPIPAGWRSAEVLCHGTLRLRWFAPPAIGLDHDPQKPHSRNEVYIVASGSGRFVRGEDGVDFGPGYALFVPAGMAHRF